MPLREREREGRGEEEEEEEIPEMDGAHHGRCILGHYTTSINFKWAAAAAAAETRPPGLQAQASSSHGRSTCLTSSTFYFRSRSLCRGNQPFFHTSFYTRSAMPLEPWRNVH